MDFLRIAKQGWENAADFYDCGKYAAFEHQVKLAQVAATIAVAERMGEPIDNHPADLMERYSGCGEDIEQHEIGHCPLCQQPWAECDCSAKAEW